MKKRLLFIFNPKSGKAQIKNKLYEIIDTFVKGGYEALLIPPRESVTLMRKPKNLRRRWIWWYAAEETERWMRS